MPALPFNTVTLSPREAGSAAYCSTLLRISAAVLDGIRLMASASPSLRAKRSNPGQRNACKGRATLGHFASLGMTVRDASTEVFRRKRYHPSLAPRGRTDQVPGFPPASPAALTEISSEGPRCPCIS